MFPGPYATVIYNEAGEPLGWDTNYPGDEREFNDVDDRDIIDTWWCETCQEHHWDDESCPEDEENSRP